MNKQFLVTYRYRSACKNYIYGKLRESIEIVRAISITDAKKKALTIAKERSNGITQGVGAWFFNDIEKCNQ